MKHYIRYRLADLAASAPDWLRRWWAWHRLTRLP